MHLVKSQQWWVDGRNNVVLFAIYLFIVIALPLTLSAIIGFKGLPCGRSCPACKQETLPVLSEFLRVVRRAIPALAIERRWCPTCEWDGYARSPRLPETVMVPLGVITRRTQQVRTLELGGRVWRVMLESWRDHGRCYGRLLFVAPSGKLWYDPFASLSAASHSEVVSQARSLSDRLLAYRLRDVISG
jgi:hypothetical protein